MRYLVISDIHGNLEALEAVLNDAPELDAVICLGDLVGYGPNPNECVDRIHALPDLTCLAGNHDLAAIGQEPVSNFNDVARDAIAWTRRQLTPENLAFLQTLESTKIRDEISLVHASPRDPVWEYLETRSQASQNFKILETALCLNGHTHKPRVFRLDEGQGDLEHVVPTHDESIELTPGKWIANVGGVGQPRDGDPRAAYGVLDTERQKLSFQRVAYPVQATQAKIREAGLHDSLAQRLEVGI